jgi:hypothetical protein
MTTLRVIVAGSRDFEDYEFLRSRLIVTLASWDAGVEPRGYPRKAVILSGAARGADELGERFAESHGLEVLKYPADWQQHGKAAGPIRNRQMARNADALVAFWDGDSRGTANMILEAHRAGLDVRVHLVDP